MFAVAFPFGQAVPLLMYADNVGFGPVVRLRKAMGLTGEQPPEIRAGEDLTLFYIRVAYLPLMTSKPTCRHCTAQKHNMCVLSVQDPLTHRILARGLCGSGERGFVGCPPVLPVVLATIPAAIATCHCSLTLYCLTLYCLTLLVCCDASTAQCG